MFKNYFSSDIFENFITVLGGIRTHYNSPIRSQMPYLLPPKAKNYKPFFINLYINWSFWASFLLYRVSLTLHTFVNCQNKKKELIPPSSSEMIICSFQYLPVPSSYQTLYITLLLSTVAQDCVHTVLRLEFLNAHVLPLSRDSCVSNSGVPTCYHLAKCVWNSGGPRGDMGIWVISEASVSMIHVHAASFLAFFSIGEFDFGF